MILRLSTLSYVRYVHFETSERFVENSEETDWMELHGLGRVPVSYEGDNDGRNPREDGPFFDTQT